MAYQPKSYKKFVATAATATLVASVVAPAASASFSDVSDRYKDAVDYVVTNNISKGLTETTFGISSTITRGDAAIMLAQALGLMDNSEAAESGFTDVPTRGTLAINSLKAAGIVNGKTSTNFGFYDNLTRGEVALMMANANAYNFSGEVSSLAFTDVIGTRYASAVAGMVEAGITSGKTATSFGTGHSITRGEFAIFVYRAETATPATPEVVSVSAINATQVEVKFNHELDATSAETVGNYAIGANNPDSAALSADGKTVTLTFGLASEVEVTNAVLVVEPITLAADPLESTAKYTQVFTYEDTVKPQLVSVESVTAGATASSVTVTVSEPVASATAKINGVTKSISFGGTDTATITGLSLDATKNHTIEILALTDKGGNITNYTSKTFAITVDTVAPTASLSAQSDKHILVTFSKPMDLTSVQNAFALNTGVKDETLANVNHSAVVSSVAGSNDTKFLIPITDTLYTNTTSRTFTVILPATLEDKLGNNVTAATTKSVVLTKDTAKPVSTGYKVVRNGAGNITDIVVEFSEGLAVNANPAEPIIVDSNGVLVTSTFLGGLTADPIVAGDKKVTYSVGTAGKVYGNYSFSFGSNLVTDQSETGNTSSAFNYTINFGTATSATNFDLTSAVGVGNTITVEFGRAVKGGAVANSATDLSNYTLGGTALPTGTTITLDVAQDTATIVLPDQSVTTSDNNAVFTVGNVKDLNGASLNQFVGPVVVEDNVDPTLSTAVLNADGTITVGFDETLDVDTVAGDFVLKLNAATLNTAEYTVLPGTGADAGKYVVTVVKSFDTGTADGGVDDKVFVDLNGNGTYDLGEIVLTSGGASEGANSAQAGETVNLKAFAGISSVTIGTKATAPTVGVDAEGNTLKLNVTKTVK